MGQTLVAGTGIGSIQPTRVVEGPDWGLDPAPGAHDFSVFIGRMRRVHGYPHRPVPRLRRPSRCPTTDPLSRWDKRLVFQVATDLRPPAAACPDGMLAVPGGRFVMGQSFGGGIR